MPAARSGRRARDGSFPRLTDVRLTAGRTVVNAAPVRGGLRVRLDDGSVREADHLLLATGYRVDIARYPFLPPALLRAVSAVNGYPRLGPGLESTVPGLHFLGAPAAASFGPLMRFVSGAGYAARAVAEHHCSARASGRRSTMPVGSRVPEMAARL